MCSIISGCLCHANTQMSPVGIKIIITSGRNKGYFEFITGVAIQEVRIEQVYLKFVFFNIDNDKKTISKVPITPYNKGCFQLLHNHK